MAASRGRCRSWDIRVCAVESMCGPHVTTHAHTWEQSLPPNKALAVSGATARLISTRTNGPLWTGPPSLPHLGGRLPADSIAQIAA